LVKPKPLLDVTFSALTVWLGDREDIQPAKPTSLLPRGSLPEQMEEEEDPRFTSKNGH